MVGNWDAALGEVVATERAFARLATDSTVQFAFLAYLDDNAILFRPGPVTGPSWLAQNPMPPELLLEWTPAYADVAADGDLGFTTGPWQSGRRGDPTAARAFGQYVTLWRRTPSGFRAVLDYGIVHEEPPSVPTLELPAQAESGALPRPAGAASESLRIADEDLDEAVSDSGASAWEAYADERIRWLRNGRLPAVGAPFPLDRPGTVFRSLGAEAAGSGDFGFSWGEVREDGDGQNGAGSYLRVWRRQRDGAWKVVLDATSTSG